jgi:hypothetical protein
VKKLYKVPIILEILRFTQNDNKRLIMKTNLKLAPMTQRGERAGVRGGGS